MALIRKAFIIILNLVFFLLSSYLVFGKSHNTLDLTAIEKAWLSENNERVFTLGVDPFFGYEYFKHEGREKGYVIPLIEQIEKDLGLDIRLEASKGWAEIYPGLQTGSVDILFGANETPERREIMAFTRPINRNPYAIIAKKDGNIHTVGDIDKKRVGFVTDDVIMDILPISYKNIKYTEKVYFSEKEAITALQDGEIDAFITAGGLIIYDYLYNYPDLSFAFKFSTLTSDMTLSTRLEDKILASILDKEIEYLSKEKLPQILSQAETDFYIKVMNLNQKEIDWLQRDGTAVIGITKDYLPFDYYHAGEYKGISGQIMKEIAKKTGITFKYNYDEFDVLNEKLIRGEIDILNIAKTEERAKSILYPQPYSLERDIILGRKDSRDVRDIFGLEGKRVAVIKGFWHYEHLTKNLSNVQIIETNNIQESLTLVHEKKADYLIENPTVARYYIEELQMYDLVEKGITSTDSYMYYGISKQKPELASIIDKVIPLLDIDLLFKAGYEEVPHSSNYEYVKKLSITIAGLVILLVLIVFFVIKLVNDLVKKRTELELLKEREKFLYTDALTNLNNSNCYIRKVKDTMDSRKLPQTVILCDMNNLKTTNDTYGHHIGDALLRLFSDVLRSVCPPDGMIFRMGGDEFYIILENTDEQKAKEILHKLTRVLKEKSITVEGKTIQVMSAFGYATRHSVNEKFSEILKIADQRMYRHKKQN